MSELDELLWDEKRVQELISQHFPTATKLDMYGAGLHFDRDTGRLNSISCQGKKVQIAES